MRSYAKSGVRDEIRAAGGELFAITSEPQTLASEAEQDWEFGFPAVGDPHQEILQSCRDLDLLDVYVNEDFGHLRERSWASHPKGYYQPAVLALDKSGRVLYRWRCLPNRSNMSGAGARPAADYTWDRIREGFESTAHAPEDLEPVLGAEDLSWLHFLTILTAHGWFIRPRAFPLTREGDKPRVSPGGMMRRVYIFVALWLAALALLPTIWVGLAFCAWLVVLTPGLIEIHRQFQNVPEEPPDGRKI